MWAKEYVVEVKVEAVMASEVFAENTTLSIVLCFTMRHVSLPHHFSKEVLSMGYIRDLLFAGL